MVDFIGDQVNLTVRSTYVSRDLYHITRLYDYVYSKIMIMISLEGPLPHTCESLLQPVSLDKDRRQAFRGFTGSR